MADKPPTVDVEFRLVEDRWRPPIKRALFFAAYVGGCAFAAYQSGDPGLSAAMVCIAGLAWPLVRIVATVAEKVSPEQADLLRERMTTDAFPRARQRRVSPSNR